MADNQSAAEDAPITKHADLRADHTSLLGDKSIPLWRRIWVSRSRISTRLVFYFIGASVITLVASGVAFVFFAVLATKLNQVNDENVPQMISAFEVAQESAALAASLPRLSTATQDDFGDIVASVKETQASFDEYIEQISQTETGSQRAAELLLAGEAKSSNIQQAVALVNKRFELINASDDIMREVSRLQDQARSLLQPLLDDQLFFAMTGYRSLEDTERVPVTAAQFDTYRHLSEIEGALESAAELIAAAFNETDSDQLIPMLEQFEGNQGDGGSLCHARSCSHGHFRGAGLA